MAASEDGPSTGARGQDMRAGQNAETYAEQRARANAMRGEVGSERGTGAIRGEQKDPSVQGNERAGGAVDSSVLAAFTQNLLSGSEVGEMDGGLDAAEEMEELDMEVEAPVQERRTKKPKGARAPQQTVGGVDEGDETEASEEDEADPTPERSKKWPRVSAKKRLRALDLPMLLAHGIETGVLVGWQADTVQGIVLALPSRSFHLLWQAHDALPGALHRVVLLQALGAHRRDEDLERLAQRLAPIDESSLLEWTQERIERRHPDARNTPGEAPDLDVLLDHYDPCHHWLEEDLPEAEEGESWAVPMWLRGALREPMELAAVAFIQSIAGRFVTEYDEADDDGANDLLAAAVERHGDSHPALARWGVTLLARADSRLGLAQAADALLRARDGLGSAD